MKIGIVGPSYEQRSLPFDAQRTINFYPVFDQQGKEVASLYGTPGKLLFGTAGSGPIRAEFASSNGRGFVVSGSKLYEIDSAGTSTLRGTMIQSVGNVTMAENNTQLAICDNGKVYIYTYATPADIITNGAFAADSDWTKGSGWSIGSGVATASTASTALSQTLTLTEGRSYELVYTITRTAGSVTPSIGGTAGTARSSSGTYTETIKAGSETTIAFTGASFSGTVDNVTLTPLAFEEATQAPDSGTIAFIDGYFGVNELDSGRFHISALNNGLAWDALDFATAESGPDELKAVKRAVGQLWLFGNRSTEIWSNTGESSFPFRRIAGAVTETGISSPFSLVEIDNSVFWVGEDEFGQGIVYRTQGFSPVRISTTPIEKRIQESSDIANIKAFSYQEEGHVFYMLTGGGLETSLVYDLTTQQWHERAYLNSEGEFETDLAPDHMFIFGKHLVGDRRNGNIYEQSLDYYDDNGDEIASERIYTHLSDEGERIRYNALEIGFETGVGTQTGQGQNPVVSLQLSKDGARTWSDWFTASLGAVGEYQTKVAFRRLGIAEQMTFKIRITDPVKRAITGSYLK